VKDTHGDLLEEFLEIERLRLDDESILGFAKKFGILGLAMGLNEPRWPPESGAGIRGGGADAIFEPGPRDGTESLTTWRCFAAALSSLLQAASSTRLRRPIAEQCWADLAWLGPAWIASTGDPGWGGLPVPDSPGLLIRKRLLRPDEFQREGTIGQVAVDLSRMSKRQRVLLAMDQLVAVTGMELSTAWMPAVGFSLEVQQRTLAQVLAWKTLLLITQHRAIVVCGRCGSLYDRHNKNQRPCGSKECKRQHLSEARSRQRAAKQ
jgi:hypothetical protein